MGSWNTALVSFTDLPQIVLFMLHENLDFVCLQEVRSRSPVPAWSRVGPHHLWCGGAPVGERATAVLVNARWRHEVRSWGADHRCCRVDVQLAENAVLRVISAHLSSGSTHAQAYDRGLNALTSLIDAASTFSNVLVVVGIDANACLQPGLVVGPHTLGRAGGKTAAFTNMLNTWRLFPLNTWSQTGWTCSHWGRPPLTSATTSFAAATCVLAGGSLKLLMKDSRGILIIELCLPNLLFAPDLCFVLNVALGAGPHLRRNDIALECVHIVTLWVGAVA